MVKTRQESQFHGLELGVKTFSGAAAVRVVHPASQPIEEHRHDWPMLTLHVLGGYTEVYEGHEARITGPAALLHPANSPHADRIGGEGLETLSIEFDPHWLRCAGSGLSLDRPRFWLGGRAGIAARSLAAVWTRPRTSESAAAQATARFLEFALAQAQPRRPEWLDGVLRVLDEDEPPSTNALARRFDLHPAWLARAYRNFTGEGLRDTIRRKRTQRAAALLRDTDLPLADIAAASGFCDQSHMNRTFGALAGRTPLQVRAEGRRLRAFAVPSLSPASGARID
ncbi:MAG: helix-turn-helix domain-containing protein [Alphaproteobacteria bacterium]